MSSAARAIAFGWLCALAACSPGDRPRSDVAPDDTEAPGGPDAGEPDAVDRDAPLEVGTIDDGRAADALEVEAIAPLPRPAPGPGFHVAGPHLQDALGRTLVLHGANVAQSTKYDPQRLPWHGPDDLAALAATGLDSVRLLIHWAAIMPREGEIDEAWLDALGERLDWAHAAGLLVILDMHQDLFGEGFGDNGAPEWACDAAYYAAYEAVAPWYLNYLNSNVQACFDHFYRDDDVFARFTEAWLAVAARHGGHPAVVGFDLLNEPHWGTADVATFVSTIWQPRQEQLAAALAGVAPGRVSFLSAPPLVAAGLVMDFTVTARRDVAYAPHFYHPAVHDGAEYHPGLRDDLVRGFSAMAETSALIAGAPAGVPVWVGELGASPSLASIGDYVDDLVTMLAERGWGFAWYSDDRAGGFGLRDAEGRFIPVVMERLAHPYARRIPGPLVSQSLDLTAGRFEAVFSWEYDAALELWAGASAGTSVEVTLVDAGDRRVPCTAGAPPGVVLCAPTDVRWGASYRVSLRWE